MGVTFPRDTNAQKHFVEQEDKPVWAMFRVYYKRCELENFLK